jgi:Spy/CpxP family protein refolding chaperone
MKHRHIWLLVLAIAASAALLTATAAVSAEAILGSADGAQDAQPQLVPPPPPPPPPGPGGLGGRGGFDRMIFDLDLTAAQAEQLKTLRTQARNASQPYEEQVRQADEGIRAAIESASFDEQAVRTLVAGQAKSMIELRVIQARTDAAIYHLLTAEQQAALANMRPPRPPRRDHDSAMPF